MESDMRYKADRIYHLRHWTEIVLSLTEKQSPGRAISEGSLKTHISQGTCPSCRTSLLCWPWVCLTAMRNGWGGQSTGECGSLSPSHNQAGLCPYPESSYTLSHLKAIIYAILPVVISSSTRALCNYLCYLRACLISAFPTVYRLQEEPLNSPHCLKHAKNLYFF